MRRGVEGYGPGALLLWCRRRHVIDSVDARVSAPRTALLDCRMSAAGRLIAAGLGFVAGSAAQMQQPALWSSAGYLLLLGLAPSFFVGAWALRRRAGLCAALLLALAASSAAFASTGLRAAERLTTVLPAELEGRDVVVTGLVASLPQRAPAAWRFHFEVEEAALQEGPAVQLPPRLAIGWYGGEDGAALPDLRAGQRWRLTLRLKRPHGLANPHGFDYELHLFERGIGATGYVRTVKGADRLLLAEQAGLRHAIDRARQSVRDAIAARVEETSVAGVLAALAVGDQAAIEREDWARYRNTGVTHLMSISGLHVTLFAWLAGGVGGWLWRRSRRALLCCPAPLAARGVGLAAACAYAVFAGWGVPAQRTVLMLATVTLVGAAGLRWGWPLVLVSAAVAVSAVDPWALLQPGFWLSFVAVGLLLASGEARGLVRAASGLEPAAPASRWRGVGARLATLLAGGLRTQVVATLGLAPLGLVFFQQISLVGFAANLVAIPVVTLLVTPLALLGVLLPPLWLAAAALVQGLDAFLQALAAPASAVWSVAAAAPWAVACGLVGGLLALLPLPARVRLLALTLLLPLLAPQGARPGERAFELIAIDVGQGAAVLVRTANHTLLYDAGPQYSAESDAGERVLLPLLRALGERRLDLLLLSHRDTDHVGGAAALLGALPVAALASSLEPAHALLGLARERGTPVRRCEAGQRWEWDGVAFELLHPGAPAFELAEARKTRPNALSCVLQLRGRWGGAERTVLLAGDIERAQEAELVARHGRALASEVLLVPHHGSKTSSSATFLDAVAPKVALVQAGYRNRFGHPAAEVLARYESREIAVVASPDCGAWRYGPQGASCWRQRERRYWRLQPDGAGARAGPRSPMVEPAPPLLPAAAPAASRPRATASARSATAP